MAISTTNCFFKPHETKPPTSRKELDKFEGWFSRRHKTLDYIASRILPESRMVARAIQNCRLKALRNPPDFETEGAFMSWSLRLLITEAVAILHQSPIEALERPDGKEENTMMTHTLPHASLSGGKKSSAKKASMRKPAGCQDTGIHHVGLRATNPAASAEFYKEVLGMEIVGGSTPDHPLGASAFLSSRPDEESHDIALFANPEFAHFAFKVSSLAELRSLHARVVEKNIQIKFAFNHRVSFAFYFDDPDGNMIEVYWPTGDLSWRQPQAEPLDLSQPDEVLLEKIAATL